MIFEELLSVLEDNPKIPIRIKVEDRLTDDESKPVYAIDALYRELTDKIKLYIQNFFVTGIRAGKTGRKTELVVTLREMFRKEDILLKDELQENMELKQQLTEQQQLFFDAKEKYVAFGGSRCCGKTYAILTKAVSEATKKCGVRILIAVNYHTELEHSIWQPICKIASIYKPRIDKLNQTILFENGSIIKCFTFEYEMPKRFFSKWDIIFVDEATHVSKLKLETLMQTAKANEKPTQIFFTITPGGIAAKWVKRVFIDRIYTGKENGNDFKFIPSTIEDNKFMVDRDYIIEAMRKLPTPVMNQWLYGKWET